MRKLILIVVFGLFITSCDTKEVAPQDNFISFKSSELGITGTEAMVEVNLSRSAEEGLTFKILLEPVDVEYGVHFITEPQAVNNILTLNIPAGNDHFSFKIIPVEGVLLSGTEYINFSISEVTDPIRIGVNKNLKLSFSKIISAGSRLTLESKTSESNYTNNVYVDLSSNSTHISDRRLWNLGFSNNSKFQVILNASYQTTAAVTQETDITQVTLADISSLDNIYISFDRLTDPATVSLVDAWDGDLTKTVFAPVSESSSENKVYIVAFEGSNSSEELWYKVKVDRNGNGYKVQYAKLGETDIKTVEIQKDSDYNMSFLSFEKGLVKDIEPKAADWDFVFGYSTYDSGLGTPYWFQDFVTLNYLNGVEAAEEFTEKVSYENYSLKDLSATEFSVKKDVIGSNWRATTGAKVGVKRDRFYVIKDPEGNIYKLNFVNAGIGSDGGERGKPVIEYKLVNN